MSKNNNGKAYVSLLAEIDRTWKALKHYWFLALLFVAVLSAGTAGLFFHDRSDTAYLYITYNYENAAYGLLPNGAKLDTFIIMSDEVMQEVLDIACITDMWPEELASMLSIVPLNSRSFSSSNPSTYYITTSYMVTLEENDALAKYRIPQQSMLRLVGNAYRNYFIKHYADDGISIEISPSGEEDMEYEEEYEFLDMCAHELLNYLSSKSTYANSFVSDYTGLSFPILRQEINNLINVSLPDCRAFILEHSIALNRTRFISKINFILDDMERNYTKGKRAFDIRGDVIQAYDGQMISTVLIPTEDLNEKFYMSKTQTGVDYLALDRSNNAISTSKVKREIEKNENIRTHMQLVKSNTAEDKAKARVLLDNVRAELIRLLEQTNQLNTEFNEQEAGEYLKIGISANGLITSLGGKRILAAGFIYVIFAVLCVRKLWSRKEKHEKV